MPDIVKTWPFTSGVEGWTEEVGSTEQDYTFDGAAGNPAGSIEIDAGIGLGGYSNLSHRFRSALETWEQWGVPAGRTVTHVRFDYDYRLANEHATAQSFLVELLDQYDVPGSDTLASDNWGTGVTGWLSKSGAEKAVDSDLRASSSQVRVRVQYTASMPAAPFVNPTWNWFDNARLTITYEEPRMAVPISNLNGMVFKRGFAYLSRIGGTGDAVAHPALQDISVSHTYDMVEARGPESVAPLAVGISNENLSGSMTWLALNLEQLQVIIGGTMAYSGGTGKTTYTKKYDEDPSPFNLRLVSPENGEDMELICYNCLASNFQVLDGSANRDFNGFRSDFRAYGRTSDKAIFQVIVAGNQTGSS